jgi:enoyl-CoA hydratase/carnithine racemase
LEATFCHACILRRLVSGTAMIPHYIGIGKFTELLFAGRRLSAAEAEELDLVICVIAAVELELVTRDFAAELAQGETRTMGLKSGP